MPEVKLINGARETILPAPRGVQVTTWTEESISNLPEDRQAITTPGIEVELIGQNRVVRIPDEGNAIYVTNDSGSTTGSYPWPPKGA